jgi:hypothetical protein
VVELEQPRIGTVRQLGVPVKLSRMPGPVHAPAPALGEHTRELLAEAGYGDAEIDELIASGAAAEAAEAPGAPGREAEDAPLEDVGEFRA